MGFEISFSLSEKFRLESKNYKYRIFLNNYLKLV